MNIKIGHLYPDLLNLYGDRGNIQCLVKRCEWRGIDVEVKEIFLEDEIDFSEFDIILLGGGSDREEMMAGKRLSEKKEELKKYVENDGVMLALCDSYPLLGNSYQIGDNKIEGLGIIDMYTERKENRMTDNIVLESELFTMPVVGFEHHNSRTYIGENRPFGKVLHGHGNDGTSGQEGVVYKNVIGTYLHGPLLPKNPQVSDYLIQKALEKKYNEPITLTPLDDEMEKDANTYMVNRVCGS